MGNKSSKKHYKIPPNAARPSSPGKPVAETQKNGVYLTWRFPKSNGNCPIIGFVVQHSELDDGGWHSSNPILGNEALIQNLERGAVYQFRVIAENLIGYSSPSPASDPILLSTDSALPFFVTPLQNVSAIENEKVEFNVQVTGNPRPKLKWFLNGDEIFPSNNLSLDEQHRRLIIKCASSDQQGELMCSASNEVGIASSAAEFTVGAPPRILDESSREAIFRVDELLRIKFTFSGKPKPDVTWFHNGIIIQEEGSNIEVLSNSTSFKIPHASRDDRGEYTIQIANNLGTDTGSVLVTVADKPISPSTPTVVLLKDNSCLLEWVEGSDDGGCPVQCFIIEYFRTGWDVWLTGAVSRSKVAKISDLIQGSKYKFRIKAENPYGISDASPESVELLIPDLSSGLMCTVPETEEEYNETIPEKPMTGVKMVTESVQSFQLSKPQSINLEVRNESLAQKDKRLTTSPPGSYRGGAIFEDYLNPIQSRSRMGRKPPDSDILRTLDLDTRGTLGLPNVSSFYGERTFSLAKTTSLPREINNQNNGDMTLSRQNQLLPTGSYSTSHLIYEGSSDDDETDTSIVTCSSLTVLKSGTCQIKTSSGEELRMSYDNLISSKINSSKNSLNSEDFDYYNSIFGKTYQNLDEEEQELENPISAENETPTVLDEADAILEFPEESNSTSWWMYFLVPICLCLFFKYMFHANVCILIYVVYRLGMLFFE